MEKQRKNSIMPVAVIGGICVVTILLVGTIWMGRSASRDTDTAVRSVSLLYLDELAKRREQVVASTLDDYIKDMDIALGLMEKDDLSSMDKLRAYQAKMKRLYGLEKFAFVDTDGMIYTSMGTRTDIDQYSFDYNNLTERRSLSKILRAAIRKLSLPCRLTIFPLREKRSPSASWKLIWGIC